MAAKQRPQLQFYLVVFKEVLFLPSNINYIVQLNKEIDQPLLRVDPQQRLLSLAFSPAYGAYLLIVSAKQLSHSAHQENVAKMLKRLSEQRKVRRGQSEFQDVFYDKFDTQHNALVELLAEDKKAFQEKELSEYMETPPQEQISQEDATIENSEEKSVEIVKVVELEEDDVTEDPTFFQEQCSLSGIY